MRPAISSSALCLAFVIALPMGCGDATRTHTAPRTALHVSESGEIRLVRDGVTLAVLEPDAVRLGVVDEVSERENYDPQHLAAGGAGVPPGFHWSAPDDVRVVESSDERAKLELSFAEEISAALSIERAGDARFAGHLSLTAGASRVAFEQLRVRVDSTEAFYGLGEYFDQVNNRGKVRAMQIELDPGIESSNNEAHVPVPFFVATRGWGLFVATSYPATFDMAAADPERVEISVGTGPASAGGLDFHWLAAAHPLDITRQYYEVTGTPRLPAPWALGPWIWRNEVAGEDARARRRREDPRARSRDHRLLDRSALCERGQQLRLRPGPLRRPARRWSHVCATWACASPSGTPLTSRTTPANRALLAEAKAGGYFPDPAGLLLLNDWSSADRFHLRRGARLLAGPPPRLHRARASRASSSTTARTSCPVCPGIRSPWGFADGSDERTMHADYQRFYHRVYAEVLPEDGGFSALSGRDLRRSGERPDHLAGRSRRDPGPAP